jgi:hypothetical protein
VSPGTRQDLGGPDAVTLGEPLAQLSPPSGRRLQVTGSPEVHAAGTEVDGAGGLARLGHRSAVVGGRPQYRRAVEPEEA